MLRKHYFLSPSIEASFLTYNDNKGHIVNFTNESYYLLPACEVVTCQGIVGNHLKKIEQQLELSIIHSLVVLIWVVQLLFSSVYTICLTVGGLNLQECIH